jgi:hypothetical protein
MFAHRADGGKEGRLPPWSLRTVSSQAVCRRQLNLCTSITHRMKRAAYEGCAQKQPRRYERCGGQQPIGGGAINVLRFLPFAPWAPGPLGVIAFIVLLTAVIGWYPLLLIRVDANWRRFGREVLDLGTAPKPKAVVPLPRDRRSDREPRRGTERRQRNLLVAVERRSSRDRRQGERRQPQTLSTAT